MCCRAARRSERRRLGAAVALAAAAGLEAACDGRGAAARVAPGDRPSASATPRGGAAVGCRRAAADPAGDADAAGAAGRTADPSAVTEDVRAGRRYACALGRGLPDVDAVLVADTAANLIARVDLYRAGRAAPWQVLAPGAAESPYRGAELFAARDLDGDGAAELLLLSGWGATGNAFYGVWRYDPGAGRFAYDSALSTLSNPARSAAGPGCVAGTSVGGDAGVRRTAVHLCPAAGGRWAVRRLVEERPLDAGRLLRVTRDSSAGRALRRVDTLPVPPADGRR
jgi:hypothetical protein